LLNPCTAIAEPFTQTMLVAGRARSGLSHKPRPVKILPKVPHTGHPSTAPLQHRTVGSARRERDAGKTGSAARSADQERPWLLSANHTT
jgi:hypothetical protein